MPDIVFRDSSGPKRKRALIRLSRKTADEPTGIAPWRTLLSFREVRSSTLLVSGVLVGTSFNKSTDCSMVAGRSVKSTCQFTGNKFAEVYA